MWKILLHFNYHDLNKNHWIIEVYILTVSVIINVQVNKWIESEHKCSNGTRTNGIVNGISLVECWRHPLLVVPYLDGWFNSFISRLFMTIKQEQQEKHQTLYRAIPVHSSFIKYQALLPLYHLPIQAKQTWHIYTTIERLRWMIQSLKNGT